MFDCGNGHANGCDGDDQKYPLILLTARNVQVCCWKSKFDCKTKYGKLINWNLFTTKSKWIILNVPMAVVNYAICSYVLIHTFSQFHCCWLIISGWIFMCAHVIACVCVLLGWDAAYNSHLPFNICQHQCIYILNNCIY